jgi:hypothetical protein
MFEHDAMAGDMPARVEAHFALRIRQDLHALRVEAIKPRIRQDIPMGCLEIVQTLDLTLTFEIARSVWKRLETVEEITKAGRQMLLKSGPVAADHVALIAIEASKAQAVAQAACLCSSSLIRWHILPQRLSPTLSGRTPGKNPCFIQYAQITGAAEHRQSPAG